MRLLIDTLIALMLTALLGGLIWNHRYQEQQTLDRQTVHRSLNQLHEQVLYQRSLGRVAQSDLGFPRIVEPTWFSSGLPRNAIAPPPHPWMDIAPPDDMASHPPDPVLTHPAQAGLWYNANLGVFRARVPAQISQRATIRLYNDLNGTQLTGLPQTVDARRRPIAHDEPGSTVIHVRDDANRPRFNPQYIERQPRDPEPKRPSLLTQSNDRR
ncbi:hypothetical protein ACERK3_04085 [Phycisphaerales bacterium AB-hyl4]|uniref:Uncharacterized protein n=1 Tax=Natronomicrosphaera hydrolytica TaxID=3242702 RepID=A0ABV4U3J0_9BACT